MIPHAFTAPVLARQLHAELLADADRHRLASGAAGNLGTGDPRRSDWRAAAAGLVTLALVLVAGATV